MSRQQEYPFVYSWQWVLIDRYGERLTNTGGNPPAELLNDLQNPGSDERPNRLLTTNVVRYLMAFGIAAQLSLLAELTKNGDLT